MSQQENTILNRIYEVLSPISGKGGRTPRIAFVDEKGAERASQLERWNVKADWYLVGSRKADNRPESSVVVEEAAQEALPDFVFESLDAVFVAAWPKDVGREEAKRLLGQWYAKVSPGGVVCGYTEKSTVFRGAEDVAGSVGEPLSVRHGTFFSLNRTEKDIRPEVSVLIPTFNDGQQDTDHGRVNFIGDLIQSLHRTLKEDPTRVEIIICDDGSTDDTHLCIQRALAGLEWPPQTTVRVMQRKHNSGRVSVVRNQLIKDSEAEYVVFIDGDTRMYTEKWASIVKSKFDENPAWSMFGAQHKGAGDNLVAFGDAVFCEKGYHHLDYNGAVYPPGVDREVDYNTICFAAVRRTALAAIGGFDERLGRGEEPDFNIALRANGHRIFVTSDVVFDHRHTIRGPRDTEQDTERNIRSNDEALERKWNFNWRKPDLKRVERLYGHTALCWNREVFSANPDQPVCIATSDAAPKLAGKLKGKEAILIGGGASLGDVKSLPDMPKMSMNGYGLHLKPDMWVCVDPPDMFDASVFNDDDILKFVRWDFRANPVSEDDDRWVGNVGGVFTYRSDYRSADPNRFFDKPLVDWGDNGVEFYHANMHKPAGDRVFTGCRSVMLVALRLLYEMGFRRVYLVGVDFDGHPFPGYYPRLVEMLEGLGPSFEERGFEVVNCNPESKLKAFPFGELPDSQVPPPSRPVVPASMDAEPGGGVVSKTTSPRKKAKARRGTRKKAAA